MHAVVALGGDADPSHVRQVLARAQLVIAADGGAAHIEAAGGVCDMIVGDQDSVPAATLDRARAAGADIRNFPTAKDATDGELALREAASRGASSITIIGALGGPRVDHLLANVALLAHPSLRGADTVIEDTGYRIWLVSRSSSWGGAAGDCVTLLAVGGDAHGVTTQGLRYVLRDGTLAHGSSLGVSNEMAGPHAEVSVAHGTVLVIHERQSG
ncbi:MAG: thiamine diphosphokinase [Chloroflexi bacterium]|nr:thiamine diphosphokinase [Chloroflexota bacterium]